MKENYLNGVEICVMLGFVADFQKIFDLHKYKALRLTPLG